ncbi:MAG: TIR domain-containing protein [Halioglobus sp.]
MSKRYRAFVSYSHADEQWAVWLHRELEKYKIPRHIRAENPQIPVRLNPVFLDRQELASSGDLSSSIKEALAQSEALLLVCSHNAAASKWVNEEIKAYRNVNPGGLILCFMVSGSPDPEDSDCAFPSALLYPDGQDTPVEPLAADVRETADGQRGALLKIVSGLIGVGVDALRRRDHQRRVRLLSGIAALATFVSAVTIVLAIAAVNSRNEAEIRRGQAEELIDFMLVELRAKLEPQGKLSLLDSVGDKAVKYFSALGKLGTEKELLMRAMALRQIGEVRFDQGYLEPALNAFEESLQLTEKLYQNAPDNDEILFEHSQSEFWVGYVAWSRHDFADAERSFKQYYTFSLALAERNPNQKYQMELVYALSNLAALARDFNDLPMASAHIDEAITHSRDMLANSPNDNELLFELSASLSFLGSILTQQAFFAEGEATFQELFDIQYALHEKDIDRKYSYQFCLSAYLLGDVQLYQGKLDKALQSYKSALGVIEKLVESDPENASFRATHYRVLRGLGTMALVSGDDEQAVSYLEAGRNGFELLLEEDPTNNIDAGNLATIEAYLAQYTLQNGDPDKALILSSSAYDWVSTSIDGSRLSARNRPLALNIIDIHARVLAHNDRKNLSKEIARGGLALIEDESRVSIFERAILAKLHSQLGENDRSSRIERDLGSQGFRDPRHSREFAYF